MGELPPEEVAATDDERARLTDQADRLEPATVHRLVDLLRDVHDQVNEGADPRLPLELALVRICRPAGRASNCRRWSSARPARGRCCLPAAPPPPRTAGSSPAEPAGATPPPPPPPPAPVIAPPQTNLALVPEQWRDTILPELARRHPALAALVNQATDVHVQGDQIVISFPQSRAFARTGTDTPAHRKQLAQVLAMAAGGTVDVRLTVSDDPEPEPAHEELEAERQPTLSEDEFLTHVKHTFDASEIEEPQR